MKWLWWRDTGIRAVERADAEQQLQEAKDLMDEARKLAPEAQQVARRSRIHRERNRFAETIEVIFRSSA